MWIERKIDRKIDGLKERQMGRKKDRWVRWVERNKDIKIEGRQKDRKKKKERQMGRKKDRGV